MMRQPGSAMPTMQPGSEMLEPPDEPLVEEGGDGGYCIKIEVHADGTFSVGKYPLTPEGPAAGKTEGASMAMPEGQEVDNITDALKVALGIWKQNPIGEDAQRQFRAGFEKSAGASAPPQGGKPY